MTYTKVNWVDGTTPENAVTLGQMDQGIADLDAAITDADAAIAALDTRLDAEEAQPNIPTVVNGSWIKGVGGAMVWDTIDIAEVTGLQAALDAKEDDANKAVANGYASLGSDGKVPTAQLPVVTGGGVVWEGAYSAATAYQAGDIVSYNGRYWLAAQGSTGQTPI